MQSSNGDGMKKKKLGECTREVRGSSSYSTLSLFKMGRVEYVSG